ncbi:MAG: UDPGP type 1 family protein [Lentisphaerae bacterium]|jgi:UDP-N-acetylglucosamine/UDP-N-acetylgalactosamine diphosphorylase|nr:UDPGP type 1 family protein [Lentisphaerota bacterium]
MKLEEAKKLLEKCGQEHVLAFWNKLGKKEREALLAQVATIEPESVKYCQEALAKGADVPDSSKGKAPKVAVLKGKKLAAAVEAGEKELKAGRVAALLVAGGQGSRLGYDGPKGCYSIGPITDAPLFYFHARKILARTIRYGRPIPFYVMTSEANNAATVECFEKNDYFGLNPKDVFFFTQGMWPGMTKDGKIILDAPGHVFMSPDGHGGLLAALKKSGALADMKKRGIKSVFFFQVDNPLVEIADPAFIGYHVMNKSEYSLKLCAKRDPKEKVGVPMQFGKTFRMVEYTEMTDEQCNRKAKDGSLYFLYGSPAIHVFDREFLDREASQPMPLHLAFKKIPQVDGKGKVVKPTEPNGYKFEKFIFDILPKAKVAAFLAFEQKDEFSPVKNAEGGDSPATCKADMQAKWRRWLAEVGVTVAEGVPLEIDPLYAVDAADLKANGICLDA